MAPFDGFPLCADGSAPAGPFDALDAGLDASDLAEPVDGFARGEAGGERSLPRG